MKKFILILFREFKTKEESTEIVTLLTPIVDSKFMKFRNDRGSMILHFESEVDQSELVPFIQGVLFGIVSSFILSELTDKLSLQMPKDILEHLLDLDNEGESTIKINLNNHGFQWVSGSGRDDAETFIDEEDESDFIALLLEDVKRKIKRPSLDQILEKIKHDGIKSLSQFEKDTLEEYSKK